MAIHVHRSTRPGLLESVYEGCLCHGLEQSGIPFARPAQVPVRYRDIQFDEGFPADILGDHQLAIAIKAVANVTPVQEARLLIYLRTSGLRLGPLFNFHARPLKDGLRRAALQAAA